MRVINEATFRFINFFMPLFYLRTLRQDVVVHQVDETIKMKMRVGSYDKWATYQAWKFGEYKSKDFTIKSTDIVIDIGGHIGSFSIWAAQQAKDGEVYTFEPNHENFSLLKENKKINGISNLKIFNLAVSDTSGEVTFFNSAHQSMGHSLYENGLPNKTVVKTISLAEILESNHIERVDFLKIDAEGAEYSILLNTFTFRRRMNIHGSRTVWQFTTMTTPTIPPMNAQWMEQHAWFITYQLFRQEHIIFTTIKILQYREVQ